MTFASALRFTRMRSRILLIALGVLAVSAPAAAADTVVAAAPGAQHVTANGGYVVWAQPTSNGRWRLAVRAPNGTVSLPSITDFGAPPPAQIGSTGYGIAGRRLLAVYSRCQGTSAIAGCDVWAYDLRAGTEERIDLLASRTYSETAPSLELGHFAFVRRGNGPRKGLYRARFGSQTAPQRLSTILARETATNGSRVAYTYNSSRGGGLAIRRFSAGNPVLVPVSREPTVPRSPLLTRYNAAWLLAGGEVQATKRFAGSGGPYVLQVVNANRALPATTNSIALRSDQTAAPYYLDADGIKLAAPPLF